MRGESMKDKSKKSTYSTTFGVDPKKRASLFRKPRKIAYINIKVFADKLKLGSGSPKKLHLSMCYFLLRHTAKASTNAPNIAAQAAGSGTCMLIIKLLFSMK